jgi:hypothetical protein
MALAEEIGNARSAGHIMGTHHSTYYRWRSMVVRYIRAANLAAAGASQVELIRCSRLAGTSIQ